MPSLRKIAKERACIHQEMPVIPGKIAKRFPRWSHFQIRSYHKRVTKKKNGRTKATRRVTGIIFIHLARENNMISSQPAKILYIKSMTRRNFTNYVRTLTNDHDGELRKAFS